MISRELRNAGGCGIASVGLVVLLLLVPMLSDPGVLAAVLVLVGFIGGGLWLAPRLLTSVKWHRPVRLLPDPPPDHWADIVRERVPITEDLRAEDFEHLLKLIQVFLTEKNIEGAGGFDVTEEAAVTIAAQACLLLIWRNTGMYPGLRTIIVYPSATIPKILDQRTGRFEEFDTPILGQSWATGVVILSWSSAEQGAFDPRDGKNVVLHEFAHQLDQETGDADGVPVGLPLSAVKPWAEVMESRFRQLKAADQQGRRTVLDGYGATNHAEFFAVATEAFFEKPERLRHKKPDLYGLLTEFYGVDPAEGMRRMGDGPGGESE